MTTSHTRSNVDIRENGLLKPHTTFKIGGPARYFASVSDAGQVGEAIAFARRQSLPIFVLGGGSNILVSDQGFDGLVLHPSSRGVEKVGEDAEGARLRIHAGEPWDDAVEHAVGRGWWGIENLSHIPGQSAAALVQNIGAYGQQLSDVLESAEVLELPTGGVHDLQSNECGLSYRRSIFNTGRKGDFLILGITLRLSTRPQPNLGYRGVRAYFDERSIAAPSQLEIRQAIIAIRDRKFPYPREERGGNAGSFFKNPTLSPTKFQDLEERVQARFGADQGSELAELRDRSAGGESVKIPAALLIDLCRLKGFEIGRARVNPSQPLVILNLGGATADDVLRLAGHVRRTVYRETGVRLDLEPELVGFAPGDRERYLGLD
ncbi:MAG TPA: UDP-N-acetylmuramate dehydrogenase [Terriglobia bacterium]